MQKATARKLTKESLIQSLKMQFEPVLDPREGAYYEASALLVLATVALMSGCEHWTRVSEFCSKRFWLCQMLGLTKCPSHDTFSDFFNVLDHEQFAKCYTSWIYSVVRELDDRVIAIDGKALLPTKREKGKNQCHLVTAFIADINVSLSHVMTGEKSNEIKAVQKLLDVLDIKGAVITMDAMGCQRDAVAKIIKKKADYCIALKGNQGITLDCAELFFKDFSTNGICSFEDQTVVSTHQTVGKNHGRIETRSATSVPAAQVLGTEAERWAGIKSVTMIESTRYIVKEKTESTERRYYISSLEPEAQRLNEVIRKHWSVENNLHWHLDVTFGEDTKKFSSKNAKNAAANMSLIRKMALAFITSHNDPGRSVATKQMFCMMDPDYCFKVLSNIGNI